jgi:hypothetical protein
VTKSAKLTADSIGLVKYLGLARSARLNSGLKLPVYLRNLYRRVPRLFLAEGQSSSTVESEAILATHRLAGRGHHHSQDRLNITVVRYI